MVPGTYTADDRMQPVYCLGCRLQLPIAMSNANNGFCDDCLATSTAIASAAVRTTPPIITTPPGGPILQPGNSVRIVPTRSFWPTTQGWILLLLVCVVCPAFPLLVVAGSASIVAMVALCSPWLCLASAGAMVVLLVASRKNRKWFRPGIIAAAVSLGLALMIPLSAHLRA